jgi:hypothetical protein
MTPPAMPPGGAAPSSGVQLTYQVPEGWVQDEPKPMRVVSFRAGPANLQTEVVVSVLPAHGAGSYLDNVNRWRIQVGLPPIRQADPQPSQPMKIGGENATVFDFVGTGDKQRAKRMIVAWVPKNNDWWFFKLIGTDAAVGEQQAAFDNYLKSVKFIPVPVAVPPGTVGADREQPKPPDNTKNR